MKVFENYIGKILKYNNESYCSIVPYNKIKNNLKSNVNRYCESKEDLICECLYFEKKYENDIFSICFGNINIENISEKNVKKLKKNGILFCDKTLFLDSIEKVNITKFKKKLSLSKYCQEKSENNLKNDVKLKDIFIYFTN